LVTQSLSVGTHTITLTAANSSGLSSSDNITVRIAPVCSATLSPDLVLHIPIITFGGQSYWADFRYIPGTFDFAFVTAGLVTETARYSSCAASTLAGDLKLHISLGIYSGIAFQADLEYVPAAGPDIVIRLTSVAGNDNF
ncbi:MAG: hypothetical protein HZA17_12275, partial [Nitrospirae bacterium]|nr:hypothetical protein [Nitrospirota bacterium]